MPALTIVATSDTHGRHEKMVIPPGDVFIHAGDLSAHGTLGNLARFNDWLGTLPHRHKLIIAGNHDFCFERTPDEARALVTHATYLQDEAVEIEGVKFYGSPWQPWFMNWAFNLGSPRELREKWDLIPADTDVLITHGPAYGHADLSKRGEHLGCREMLDTIEQRVRPGWHIFGHIHEAHGSSRSAHTTHLNVSACDFNYRPVNAPTVFTISLPVPAGPGGESISPRASSDSDR